MHKTENKKVMIFGTFDHFHAGHEDYIKQAKALGNHLIAVVARDETVTKIKGRKPDNDEKTRLQAVKTHPLVDKAVLGNPGDKFKVILKFQPDILALGYDQYVFTFLLPKFIIKNKLKITINRLNPYKPEIFKSSLLRHSQLCSEN